MHNPNSTHDVVIIGGGMAGLALAALLGAQGRSVTIFERAPKIAPTSGRSINFTLTSRGLRTLAYLGLKEQVLAEAQPLKQRTVHGKNGKTSHQPYDKGGASKGLWSIKRTVLHSILEKNALRHGNVAIQYGWSLEGLDVEKRQAILRDGNGLEIRVAPTLLVGADGTFSRVRQNILRFRPGSCTQRVFAWGYQELTISVDEAETLALESDSLHVWRSAKSLLVGIPNRDGSLSCIIVGDFEQGRKAQWQHGTGYSQLLQEEHPEIYAVSASARRDASINPVLKLNSVTTDAWSLDGWVVLLGDACHSMFPFYGQGLNSALEDAMILNNNLAQQTDVAQAIADYVKERQDDGAAIVELSEDHFYTLIDKVGTIAYSMRSMVDRVLNRVFRSLWLQEYEEISNGELSYAKVRNKLLKQDQLRKLSGLAALEAFASCLVNILAKWRRSELPSMTKTFDLEISLPPTKRDRA